MDARFKTALAGASLVIPAYVGTFSAGVPTLYCPLPALTTLPAFFVYYAAALIPAALFFVWNPGLLHGKPNVPKRTVAAAAVLSVVTVVWFIGSWEYGVEFQGTRYTVRMLLINLAWLAVIWSLILSGLRRPSYRKNLGLHWLMFAWLGTYAFPWLGELP